MSHWFEAVSLFAQQTVPAQPTPAPSVMQTAVSFLPMALMVVGFWFLFIAPQRKKQKETEKMLAALETGDEVITTGGIFGTIANVKDDRFVVRVSDNTKIEIGKAFVQAVVKKAT